MASDSVAGWWADFDAVDFDQIDEYYEALVGAYLASDGESAVDDAVARFVAPVNKAYLEAADPEQAVPHILWDAWEVVVLAAEVSAGPAQERLAELVAKIGDQSLPEHPDGRRDFTVWGNFRVYADRPAFGANMREEWDLTFFGQNRPPEAWPNLNAFAARLTVVGVDFSLYALWTLRDCLEEKEEASSAELALVAQWFTICGSLLASHSARGYSPPEWDAAARVGELCTRQGITEGGFSPRRWKFWRSRLEAHAKGPDADAHAALAAFNRAAG